MLKNFTQTQELLNHNRLFGLDLMRACSIVMVFLSHSAILNPLNEYFPYFGWLGLGVEAFFVLSGFLIGRIILRTLFYKSVTWHSVRVFWVNRWLRTVPAYFFTLIIYYCVTTVPPNTFFYWFFSQNMITPIPDFFVHSWSLSVEEWFYLTFPIVLLFIVLIFNRVKSKFRLFGIGVAVFIVLGLITKVVYYALYKHGILAHLLDHQLVFPSWKKFLTEHGHWDNMRKIVPFRFDAIAYGCIIAYLAEKLGGISGKHSIYMLLAGVTGLFVGIWVMSETVAWGASNFFADVFLLPLFSVSFALMIPSAILCPAPKKIIVSIVTIISITSYSFYLIHFLILDKVLENLPVVQENGLKWLILIGTYGATLLASYFMYRLVEIPFLNYRKKLSVRLA